LLSDNTFGFEDLTGGDKDFNDIVAQVRIALSDRPSMTD
jgi:hypothetical protein